MFRITIKDLKKESKLCLDMADAYDMAVQPRIVWALIDIIQKIEEAETELSDETILVFTDGIKEEKSWAYDWLLLQNLLPNVLDTAIDAKKYDQSEISFNDLCQSAFDKTAIFLEIENSPNSKVKVNPNTAFGVGSVVGLSHKYKSHFSEDFKISFEDNVRDKKHGDYHWAYIGEYLEVKLQQILEKSRTEKLKESLTKLQSRNKPIILKRRPKP